MQTGAACGVCSLPVAPHVQISFETFWAEMLEGIWSWDEETVLEVKRSRDAGGSLWLPDCPQAGEGPEKPTGPRKLTSAHAELRRQQQRRATVIPPMGTDASMVPLCHLDGDLRDGELEKAKPLPGDRRLGSPNRCQPEATGDGEGWRVRQDRASSGTTFPAAVPVEARWWRGHSPCLGAQGWGSTLGRVPCPGGHCPGSPTGICSQAYQKFLSLPGGSFFSCHSVPPLPPCCSVPSSRSLVPRNQRTAGKIPTMWLEVWGVFGGDVLGSVPLPTRTSTPLPLCVCFAKGPHCTTAFSLLRGGLMAKSALLLPARAGRSRQGRRTVLAAGSFHADGCLTQPGNEMSRTGRAGRSLGIRSELVPLQLALSPSERSLVTCIPSGRPQGCPQHFGIMQMPGLLPPPSQLKQLVSPSAARASSWGNGGTKRGVLVPRAGHHYWGEAEIQKPSAKPQEQQAPSPGPLPWPI
ncbi:uncharacterized protein ACIBXB_009190 isoform 2-T3 [Morphnus guianensis]